MSNNDIFFLALVGSRNKAVIDRLSIIQNETGKRVLPFPVGKIDTRESRVTRDSVDAILQPQGNFGIVSPEQQFFPVGFAIRPNDKPWYLPVEPMISNVSGGWDLKRNSVAKFAQQPIDQEGGKKLPSGTIKERISPKDYDIQITGILIGKNETGKFEDTFPKDDFKKLVSFCEAAEVYVFSPILELHGINKLVIESFDFPFTKGENLQVYNLKCISDSDHRL